jgi:hypothetical protein
MGLDAFSSGAPQKAGAYFDVRIPFSTISMSLERELNDETRIWQAL